MAMSMQQIASLLCDAPPRLNIKSSRKRRQAPAQPEQSDLEQRLSCIPGALASRFLGGISLCQVCCSCCPQAVPAPLHGGSSDHVGADGWPTSGSLSPLLQASGPNA